MVIYAISYRKTDESVKPVLNTVGILLRDVKMTLKVGLKFGSSTFF